MKKTSVTPEDIAAWKAKHGDGQVKEFTVPLDDDNKRSAVGYFSKPDLKTIGAAGKFAESDPIRSGMILFDSCFLGGDAEFRENDEVKMSAIQALNRWFKVRTALIKNV